MGLFDGVPGPRGRSGAAADLAARFALAGAAGSRRVGAGAVRGRGGARASVRTIPNVRIGGRRAQPLGSDRHRTAGRRCDRAARRAGHGRAAARRDARAARAAPRPRSGERACRSCRAVSIGSPTWRNAISISTPYRACAAPVGRAAAAATAVALPPPGQRIALASDAAFSFVYAHMLDRLAAGRRRDIVRSRRSPTSRRRRTATSAGCPAAIRNCTPGALAAARALPARARAVRGDAAGARRVRRLHGARGRARRRGRRAPRHDGPARSCDQLRQAQAASRLSRGAAARRQSDRASGQRRSRATSFTMRRSWPRDTTSRWSSLRMPKGDRSAAAAAGAAALPARSFTPSRARSSTESCARQELLRFVGDAGLGERGHARVAGERGAQHRHRECRAGPLAEPHAEIEQRREPELAQQHPMRRLGRDMRRQSMIERIGTQLRQWRDRRGRDKAVEQHRNARCRAASAAPRMAASSRPPSAAALASGSASSGCVPGEPHVDRGLLARQAHGRRRRCRDRPSARRRRRTAPRRWPPRPSYSRFPSRRGKRGRRPTRPRRSRWSRRPEMRLRPSPALA